MRRHRLSGYWGRRQWANYTLHALDVVSNPWMSDVYLQLHLTCLLLQSALCSV